MIDPIPVLPVRPFPKIARWAREVVVTEKIDGTLAGLHIDPVDDVFLPLSKSGPISQDPKKDNFGFLAWCIEHREVLTDTLGIGTHYGEWWGSGIQRGYGLTKGERRWSLFNVNRWEAGPPLPDLLQTVPILWRGQLEALHLPHLLESLRTKGSRAAPGFMQPEGLVIFHIAAGVAFKKTLEHDEAPKGIP